MSSGNPIPPPEPTLPRSENLRKAVSIYFSISLGTKPACRTARNFNAECGGGKMV